MTSDEHLKVTTYNCKNIKTSTPALENPMKESHILCLQETWLYNFEKDYTVEPHLAVNSLRRSIHMQLRLIFPGIEYLSIHLCLIFIPFGSQLAIPDNGQL
jgi:hypothetical protein